MMPTDKDVVRQRMADIEKDVRSVRLKKQAQPEEVRKTPRPFWIVLVTLLTGFRKN